ncbi:DJ-1/PfpI family protein [Dendryphion nanum]|uniref:DJ-1/PfpI family protein n=1 Tax=Dendryphion nanum TaxID=256645 RepID=A0A9P9DZI8_9PLEO|nr:DJ-1/PfpI family protein [Dendryphion nanum]
MKFPITKIMTVATSISIAHCTNTALPFFDINGTSPIHYGILLFPGFQALDVYGPLDVLNSLALLYKYPMRLTVLADKSQPVPTHIRTNATNNHPLTQFDQRTVVDRTFAEQLAFQEVSEESSLAAKEKIDVLIVPGGAGTRQNVSAEIDFVKQMYPSLKSIFSICTGASILARAGVIDGKRATTNKRAWTWATSTGPKVDWVGEARWVIDGNVVTSSGVAAGIDATYAFVGLNYGKGVEENLAASAEYTRYVNASFDPFSHVWNVTKPYDPTVPVIGL